jgi:hypothetical protein
MMEEARRTRGAKGHVALTRGEKWLVFSASIGVWLTGALWLVYKYFLRIAGEFGPEHNPLEALWQKLHGGFGYYAAFALGLLWSIHVVRGWTVRWRRWSGGTLFGVAAFLAISGAALYYISDQDWHDWTGIAHWAVGLAALAAFLVHWLSRSRPGR